MADRIPARLALSRKPRVPVSGIPRHRAVCLAKLSSSINTASDNSSAKARTAVSPGMLGMALIELRLQHRPSAPPLFTPLRIPFRALDSLVRPINQIILHASNNCVGSHCPPLYLTMSRNLTKNSAVRSLPGCVLPELA